MGDLRRIQQKLEKRPGGSPGSGTLLRRTAYLLEVPSKIGLSLMGFRLFLFISTLVVLAFLGFALSVPKYDYITEKRLGDNYRKTFSEPLPDQSPEPHAHVGLVQPLATGLDQDKERIFLGTRGHGIQALNKQNSLWITYDAVSTGGELPNDISEVAYREGSGDPRLWALGFDGSVAVGRMKGTDIDFDRIFARGFWRFITREEITATLMIGSETVIFGTSSKGAGAYNVRNHGWFDFPEIRDANVKKIFFTQNLLWFLTDSGIHVYTTSEEGKHGLTFHLEPKYQLEEKNLTNLRVFEATHAMAFSEDLGCYIFGGAAWSEKLLGGASVPGLSQESIRFALFRENLIVVIGEIFGVAGYDPEHRRWRVIKPGPLPTLNGFDHDEHSLALASDSGLFLIRGSTCNQFLQDELVLQASLWEGGCLYLLKGGGKSDELVGWISPTGERKILISKSALNIPSQPQITDVLFHQGKFWIGTESNGVILYSVRGRELGQANTSDRGQIQSVKRLGLFSDRPHLLSVTSLYRWEGEKWTFVRDGVLDFKTDPKTGEIWLKSNDGSLIRCLAQGGEERWFSGTGPERLSPEKNLAAFSQSGEDPRVYFPDLTNRKMYAYHLLRGAWDEPAEIAGKHSFRSFVRTNDALYSVDPAGVLYRDDQIILADGSKPGFPLKKAIDIRQPGGHNSIISVYGPRNQTEYTPKLGRWNNKEPYPFLQPQENIAELLPMPSDFGGRLAITSQNRLLLLGSDWQKADQIGADIRGDHFDGRTLWDLKPDGSIRGATIQKNQDGGFKTSQAESFAGSAPDLSSILEAWYEKPAIFFATPSTLSIYDTSMHSWKNKQLPQKAKKVTRNGARLQVLSEGRLSSLNWPDLKGDSIELPNGEPQKINSGGGETVITMGDGQHRRVYFQAGDSWTPFDLKSSPFSGNLDAITRIFSHDNALLVYDPSSHVCGRYASGDWTSYALPRLFTPKTFWEGANNQLFLVGRRGNTDLVDVPLYYLGQTGFSPLGPLPTGIKAARIEQDRFLWLQSGDGDIFIYDLASPQTPGLSILNTCFSAKNGTATAYSYDFRHRTYAKVVVSREDRGFIGRIAASGVTDLITERDPKTQVLTGIFIKTRRGMFCFEVKAGEWLLTSEFKVAGRLSLDQAMQLMQMPLERVEPENLGQAHFLLFVEKEGEYPFLKAFKGKIQPGSFTDPSQKEFPEVVNPAEINVGGLKAVLGPRGPAYYVTTTSGKQMDISHAGGRFETDLPFIDATVDSSGRFLVLRGKNLITYADRTLSSVVDMSRSSLSFPGASVLDVEDGRLLLRMPDGISQAQAREGTLQLIPYETGAQEIYARSETGLKIIKEGHAVFLTVHGRPFSGKEKFPFDKIRKIGTEKSRLHLISEKNFWTFATTEGRIANETFLALPSVSGTEEFSFLTCSNGGTRLRIGEKLFAISNTLNESPPSECVAPTPVANEDNWRWYRNPDGKGVYFEAQMDGAWRRLTREACDDCGFLDDTYSWVTGFGNHIYAAHGLGVTIVAGGEKEGKRVILGKKIDELKASNGILHAISSDSSVFRLSAKDIWEPADEKTAKLVFSEPTTIYKDCLLQVESLHENIQIRTLRNQPLQYVPNLHKFKLDLFNDFASFNGGLYVINGQDGRVAQFDPSGRRAECHLDETEVKRLETRGGLLNAVGTYRVLALTPQSDKVQWRESPPLINLGGSDGLSFQLDLLARNPGTAISPVLAGHHIPQFWADGRFLFDKVSAIKGASSAWWALSPAGLLKIGGGDTASFDGIFFPPGPASRLAQRESRLHVEMGNEEKYLDEATALFEPVAVENSAFTRTVFDLSPDEKAYAWQAIEVKDSDPRPTFYLNRREGRHESNVFLENRFVWDQIVQAAFDPDKKEYWLISPSNNISVNSARTSRESGISLSLLDFPRIPFDAAPDLTLADAVFSKGNLYTLHVNSRNEELVKKRSGTGWERAPSEEYPFWYQAVDFNLTENLWRSVPITHTQFHNRQANFTFIGPKDYPLFAELEWAPGYGKFSFDYLLSIHPFRDMLWAGSKGGLLKFRFDPEKKESNLEFERIFLPEDGLTHYYLTQLKRPGKEEMLGLLEKDETGEETVKQLSLPGWVKLKPEDFPGEITEYPFPGGNGVKFVFTFDPVRDEGVLSLNTQHQERIELLRCARRSGDSNSVHLDNSGHYIAQGSEDLFIFDPPAREKGEVFSRLGKSQAARAVDRFAAEVTDPAGLAWGATGAEPALRFPSGKVFPAGEVFTITALSGVASFKVDSKTLRWVVRNQDVQTMFLFNYDSGEVKEVTNSQEGDIEWVEYEPPGGTGIYYYLEKSGFVKEQNLLAKLMGRKRPDLEKWVLIIAEKNNIPWGGHDKLDYPLMLGKKYLMPSKTTAARSKIENQEQSPLAIAGRAFMQLGGEECHASLAYSSQGPWGFSGKDFLQLDLSRKHVYFHPLPDGVKPLYLCVKDGRILLGGKGGEGTEIWQYVPQQLGQSSLKPAELRRVALTESKRTLEAAPDAGLIVDNGRDKIFVGRSDEWFFGTSLSRVVGILKDSDDEGYWIATDSAGLIWSRNPFL